MTLAFQRRTPPHSEIALSPELDYLTSARLARLRPVALAAPSMPASETKFQAAEAPANLAPWEAVDTGGRSIGGWKRLVAPILLVMLLGVGLGVLIFDAHGTARPTSLAGSSTEQVGSASPAQPAAEQPLPQDLAAMAAGPAAAPVDAPAAVLKALSNPQPAAGDASVAVESAPASPAAMLPAGNAVLAAVAAPMPANAEVPAAGGWVRTASVPAVVMAASPNALSTPVTGWAKTREPQVAAVLRIPDSSQMAKQTPPRTTAAPVSQAAVTWPASGPLTSLFGPSHPLGIDIGIALGTPLRAAAAGRVAFTGGDPCCSYGYYIDIDHGSGVMTRYGHLIEPSFLQPGQLLRMGDVIGYSGSTGNSTGPHLHFEIRLNGRPVDPLLVLP